MSIGEVARRAGIAPSAIRDYDSLGLVPAPPRAGGKRRFNRTVLDWLRLVALAREAGFTIAETRQLIAEFEPGTPPAVRWNALATRKLAEIDVQAARLTRMRQVLERALACGCLRLEDCGVLLGSPASGATSPRRSARSRQH